MGGVEAGEVGEPTDTMELKGPEPDTEGDTEPDTEGDTEGGTEQDREGDTAGLLRLRMRTWKPGEEDEVAAGDVQPGEEDEVAAGDVQAAEEAVNGVLKLRLAGRGGSGGPSASVLLLLLLLPLVGEVAVVWLPPRL